jgi:hypothetical protein
MDMRRLIALLLSAFAVLCLAAVATGQGAAPAPGCAGVAFTDDTGDVSPSGGPTATNLDLKAGWFNTDKSGVVTANLQVANMSATPAPPATAASWYYVYTVGTTVFYVDMEADVTGAVIYEYGNYVVDETNGTATYTPTGETKGSFTEGADGVISMVVPKGAKGAVGQKLTASNGQTSPLIQNGLGGGVLLPGDDTAPEDGKTYDVGACELGTGGGTTTPPPAATPVPGQAPTPAPAAGGTAAPKLPLTLKTKSVKAKKGTLAIKLKASAAVTKIGARVRKANKAFGTGRLAKLAKGKTGTVKVKAKKAKKGSYLLDVTARLADGRLASATFKLKVK